MIFNSLEPGSAGNGGGDVVKGDGENRVHLDLALFHPIALAHRHPGSQPDSHAARDPALSDSLAQTPGEQHLESLRPAAEPESAPSTPRPALHQTTVGGTAREDPGARMALMRSCCFTPVPGLQGFSTAEVG